MADRKTDRDRMESRPATLDEPRARQGEETAREHRRIQDRAEELRRERKEEQEQGGTEEDQPVQAGAREQPTLPYPEQHLEKPGLESELDPRPRYMAPDYQGSGKLEGMVALVTGGDSGIGRAVAVLYAREGADVAVVYLSEHADAEETKRAVEGEGQRCVLIAGDVTDPGFCREAVEKTVQELGKLDVLVNNAAFQEHQLSIEDITDEQFDRTLRTNVYGYFYMARAALPHLGEGSSIVNTGSVVGLMGHKSLVDYGMTKGAIHNFTQSLAQQLAPRGIRVNAVAPGPVWTPLNPADQPAEKMEQFGKKVLMGRPAQPEELSPVYVFLAAPVCSAMVTGQVYPVIGGEPGSL